MKDVRAEIEAAFRRRASASVSLSYDGWENRPGAEAALALAADRLAIIANRGPEEGRPEQFREVGRGTAQAELDALAADAQVIIARAEKMVERAGGLHATTIDALATEQIMRAEIERRASAIIEIVRPLVAAYRAADVSAAQETAGRGHPPKHLANAVARDVVQVFEKLTGRRADLGGEKGLPGAVPLVGEIFALLAIAADAKVAVKNMLDDREEQKQWAETKTGDPSPPA